MKIGIIKEGKVPQDRRVPFTPKQCKIIQEKYLNLEIKVQKSDIRCYRDSEYEAEGVELVDSIADCDILFGVKEVPIEQLIPNKTYLYFSHTHKLQEYNQKLIRANIDKNIRLIDYECLLKPNGQRVLGFGRFAGLVGAYNAFLAYGKKFKTYDLRPANQCHDLEDMMGQLKEVILKKEKIVLTGKGRVARGAKEILDALGIEKVESEAFLSQDFNASVYAMINVQDYIKHPEKAQWTNKDFFANPEGYESDFLKYCAVADMFIAGHFWDNRSPVFFTEDEYTSGKVNFKLIADISCDIADPIPTTLRPSTIDSPCYDVMHGQLIEKPAYSSIDNLTVMAVDNLPCELPRDASESFGKILMSDIIPCFAEEDSEDILRNATICDGGELTDKFAYMQEFVDGHAQRAC